MPKTLYQFKITLEGIRPSIWRRIQVPENYTFGDLHVVIQKAMGWQKKHLHQFELLHPKYKELEIIGSLDDTHEEDFIVDEEKTPIASYFSLENAEARYIYDYRDYWAHQLTLEKILSVPPWAVPHPICLEGERACPPEECGGPQEYAELIDTFNNPNHARYLEVKGWLGREGHPEVFQKEEIVLENITMRER